MMISCKPQHLSPRTSVLVCLCFIYKALLTEHSTAVCPIGVLEIAHWDIGTHTCPLDSLEDLQCAVPGVPSNLPGPQPPPKARSPQQVQHRLVVLYFGRGD